MAFKFTEGMALGDIADRLTKIQQARNHASEAAGKAVNAICLAYRYMDAAYQEAATLDDAHAFSGPQATELSEWREYLHIARDVMAEVAVVMTEMTFNQARHIEELDTVEAAAKSGMAAKRLAAWEGNALKEAVVKALAGEKAKP